jgi:V8-like Glu-specific endopeptidase
MSKQLKFCSLTSRALLATGLVAAGSSAAFAQSGTSSVRNTAAFPTIEAAASWTPARLLNAKLMEPSPSMRWVPTETTLDLTTPSVAAPGSPPIEAAEPSLAAEVLPGGGTTQTPTEDQVSPTDNLGHGPFTESRVFPVPAQTAQYPYPASTVGAFFGHDPRTGGDFRCSASVLRPRIILTAGHCVVKPSTTSSGRYFYSNFAFYPSYNTGAAPVGVWGWQFADVENAWYFSDGSVPNSEDWALLVATDNTRGQILGNITGWLGYITGAISSNHLTIVGYPCNLDSCNLMQRNDAQTFASGGNNTWILGSATQGGVSGGPWVQDFGVAPVGSPPLQFGGNLAAAVNSYGPTGGNGYSGASQFNNDFISLLNEVCAHNSGNC